MSLKAVELQIAIPKTFDAGKMADNHNQNVISQQMNANEALKKEIERKQLAVNESDDLDGIKEDQENNNGAGHQERHKKNKTIIEEKPAKHPFKGNLVDFSG